MTMAPQIADPVSKLRQFAPPPIKVLGTVVGLSLAAVPQLRADPSAGADPNLQSRIEQAVPNSTDRLFENLPKGRTVQPKQTSQKRKIRSSKPPISLDGKTYRATPNSVRQQAGSKTERK
jgi:hypothetical protein